ncbi:MAG: hypothetical protein K2M73_10375 [Lachnospiraceae bacterium]|nr:hypothetical protein [Lachnospiraceae bacterium]
MVGTYKCPGCGAPIEFNSQAGELVCSYCGTHVDVSKMNSETDKYDCVVEDLEKEDAQYGDFDSYKCSNCGAEILTDENTSATSCSYCGSPAIIKERLRGQLMPKSLIPFKHNREIAKDEFRKWTKKGMLTPACFRKEATIDSIKGIYVPFWLYDYNVHVDMMANATKVRTERKGNTEYTHTSHYQVNRVMDCSFTKIPADASEKMPDSVMDKLEPFNYNELRKFEMPYLSGYSSEKYNYTKEEMNYRAESRARGYAFTECRNSIIGYSSVNVVHSNARLQRLGATYSLLPVWILNYVFKGKQYMFAMNGQTGKIVGELPISKGKAAAWFGGVFAGVSALLLLLGGILG